MAFYTEIPENVPNSAIAATKKNQNKNRHWPLAHLVRSCMSSFLKFHLHTYKYRMSRRPDSYTLKAAKATRFAILIKIGWGYWYVLYKSKSMSCIKRLIMCLLSSAKLKRFYY